MAKKREFRVTPRVKLWLEQDDRYVFGLGISKILEAVDQTGSIKEAAASLGKSYRHVWSRIKAVEAALGVSLVETRVGGEGPQRSQLTDRARQLLEAYGQLRREVFEFVEQRVAKQLSQVTRSLQEAPRRRPGRT
jgi:molybdate transport system regulatory protein